MTNTKISALNYTYTAMNRKQSQKSLEHVRICLVGHNSFQTSPFFSPSFLSFIFLLVQVSSYHHLRSFVLAFLSALNDDPFFVPSFSLPFVSSSFSCEGKWKRERERDRARSYSTFFTGKNVNSNMTFWARQIAAGSQSSSSSFHLVFALLSVRRRGNKDRRFDSSFSFTFLPSISVECTVYFICTFQHSPVTSFFLVLSSDIWTIYKMYVYSRVSFACS